MATTTLPNPVLPDDLPEWVTNTEAPESAKDLGDLPAWVLAEDPPSKEDDLSDLIADPIDERHLMLSTGNFRAVDKEGNDKAPTGEFYVVPTPEALKSKAYQSNKDFKEYHPEFEWSQAPGMAVDLVKSLGKGVYKASGPALAAKFVNDGPAGLVKQGATNFLSLAEGGAQGIDFLRSVGDFVGQKAYEATLPEEEKGQAKYQDFVNSLIKSKSTEGQSIIGRNVRELGGDEGGAQLADQLIDQDIAGFSGLIADPTVIASGPLKAARVAINAQRGAMIARRAELTLKNAQTMGMREASQLAEKQLLQEIPAWKKLALTPVSEVPGINQIASAIPEPVRKGLSIASASISNPSATLMQGAGKVLRGTGNLVQKGTDYVLGPGIGPAIARGVIASPAILAHPIAGALTVASSMISGASPALKEWMKLGQKVSTLGDLLDTAGSAVKAGADPKAIRTAGMMAEEAGTREAAARAAGLNPEITDTSNYRRLKSPFLRGFTSFSSNIADPTIRGAALGAGFNAAAGQDAEAGIVPGALYGLVGHGFGSFGKLVSPSKRDPIASAKFAQQFLNSLPSETRKIWRKQDPRAIDFFGDVDFMVRSANNRMGKVNGKDAISIEYAGTPERMKEAYLNSQSGENALRARQTHINTLSDPNSTPEQRAQAQADYESLNQQLDKASRASGWVEGDPSTGLKMVINASNSINPGQISHESLGHIVDQIDFAADRTEGKNNPLRESKEELLGALVGRETVNDAGQRVKEPGLYSDSDLIPLAERYFAKLGLSPEIVEDPVTGEQKLTEKDRSTILDELVAEHTNVFTKNARNLGKDAVQHALDVSNGTDAEVQAMIDQGKGSSSLFASPDGATGMVISNDVAVERANAERILAFVEATAAPDATLRITKGKVEAPDAVPITKSQLTNEAKVAHEAYNQAKSLQEAVEARQAKDAMADSMIYQTANKTFKQAEREAEKEFTLKYGRKPTRQELRTEASRILEESPKVVVNTDRGAYVPGDSPLLLTKRQQEQAAVDMTQTIKSALVGPLTDENGMKLDITKDGKEIYNGKYFTPEQIKAIKAVPNAVLPKSIKDNLIKLNELVQQGDGGLADLIYHQAIKRQGNIPRTFRSISPFSFGVTKADNLIARAWDVTSIFRKLEKEGAKRESRILEPFIEPAETDYGEATDRFVRNLQQFGQNHAQGQSGRIGLHPDDGVAKQRAEAIAKFLGYSKDKSVDFDAEKANSFVRSFRVDRIFNLKESLSDPLKLSHKELRQGNFMPESFDELAEGLYYNGPQETPSGTLHYFTDLNENSPAKGGTFSVLGDATTEAIESARQKQAERFSKFMPDMQDDSLAQTAYLNQKAREMGLGTAKEMPYEKFVELAKEWRQTNPRDEDGNFTGSYEFPKAFRVQGQEQGYSPEYARKLIGGRGDAYLRDEQKTLRGRTSRGYYRAAIAPIVKWAEDSGRVFNPNLLDLAYGGGQEHQVILTPKRVLKVTMPDRSGLTIDWNDKGQHPEIAPARPEEYLERLAISNDLFGEDVRIEGIMPRGESTSLVVSQPLYRGQHPTSQEVVQYFEEGGFLPIGNDRRFYNPQENIAIFDAKPSNMIVSEKGIRPLDVIVLKPTGMIKSWIENEMAFMPELDQLPDWVLSDNPELPSTPKAYQLPEEDQLPAWVLSND